MSLSETHLDAYQPRGEASHEGRSPHGDKLSEGVYAAYFKRPLDILLVLLMLPIVLPLIGGVALLIALDGANPFYRQMRVGRNGRIYGMWKLRSMVCGADAKLDQYLAENPEAQAEWDSRQKLREDPRVTWIGRLIRKSSIDELPQLFNVLTGDMSLVGPRPMMVSQRRLYPGEAYFEMRPGITGLWQISDRNDSTFAARAKFDDLYREVISLRTDLRILYCTVGVVLLGTGC